MPNLPRIVRSRLAYDGYAQVHVLTLVDDGGEHSREVVSRGNAACVLPYDPERKLALLVRLPRAPLLMAGLPEPLLEAPAGIVDPGETAETTARREAMEEVGVALGPLEPAGVCWPSPGLFDEQVHLFLAPYRAADRTGPGGGLAEEHEGISVVEMPLTELERMADSGELTDLKTLTLALLLRLRHME